MSNDFSTEIAQLPGTTSTSEWLSIDHERLKEFAHSTFLDPESVDLRISKNNALGPDLVDGFMVLSLLMHVEFADPLIRREGLYGFNYGLDKVRFTEPIFVDQKIRYHRTVISVDAKTPTRAVVSSRHTVETSTGTTAMYAEWKTMLIDGTRENE